MLGIPLVFHKSAGTGLDAEHKRVNSFGEVSCSLDVL